MQSESTRILVVEDNPGDTELIREALGQVRERKFEITTADRLAAALKCLKFPGTDAVLLDLSLPDSQGLQTLATVQQYAGATPVVVLTGFRDEKAALDALAHGAQDYLMKGQFDGESVVRAVLYAIERKRSAEHLKRRENQLSDAQALAHLGSWEWDPKTNAMEWSDEMWRIHGLTPAAREVSLDAMLTFADPSDREHLVAVFECFRQTPDHPAMDFDYRVTLTNRAIRRFAGKARPSEGTGDRYPVVGTVQDVTERKELEDQVVFAGRMAAVGTLASGVAHEINNPLAYVMSNVDFVAEECKAVLQVLNDTHRSVTIDPQRSCARQWVDCGLADLAPRLRSVCGALADIQDGAERVRRIVRDLRVFSRADEDRRGPVLVEKCIESSIELARNQIQCRARMIKTFSGAPPVEANESRMSQVFLNLLVNAAHAIPEGHADRNTIEVRTRSDAERVIIEVIDTGCGIAPEIKDKIFDAFYTTKPPGEGTGLGLSICRGIVTASGGTIEVDSEVGKGSVFRVSLPRALHIQEHPPAMASPSVHARRGRILVIDDEPAVLRMLQRVLPGHDVECCDDGPNALARLQAGERFDIILCDLMMPEMTGMELYSELARVSPPQAERVVFLTGGAFTPRAREFLEKVSNPSIEKPFSVAHLRSCLARMLEKETQLETVLTERPDT